MAAIFGVAQPTWTNWELGKREPELDMLLKMCLYFKVSSDFLLGLSDIEKPPPASQMLAAETQTKYGEN